MDGEPKLSKKFTEFVHGMPSIKEPLLEYYKWMIRHHFRKEGDYIIDKDKKRIQYCFQYKSEKYKFYKIHIEIALDKGIKSLDYTAKKIDDYLTYEKRGTAPIYFKEYNKTIEEKNIISYMVWAESYPKHEKILLVR